MNNNYDQRGNRRFIYEAAIWHENILPGRFYKAKIGNISRSGLYFESNETLYQGEKIYISNYRPEYDNSISDNCTQVEIKWRKSLKESSFRFGYGAEFLDLANPLVQSIAKTKLKNQNSHGTSGGNKKDPREHAREQYGKEILFTTENCQYKGYLSNISRGGAFIKTKNKFALGQMVRLDFQAGKTSKVRRVKGWVARLSPTGVGIRFDRRINPDRRKNKDRRNMMAPETKRRRVTRLTRSR